MAESDMKTISELDSFNDILDINSCFPLVVEIDNIKITKKIYTPVLKTQIAGYTLTGVLTTGNTSVTIPSVGSAYSDSTPYTVGALVTVDITDDQNETTTHYYICIANCSAANWETNCTSFVEYTPVDANSTLDIYTSVFGVNPTAVSVSNNTITLTFPAQSSDVAVKVRVS